MSIYLKVRHRAARKYELGLSYTMSKKTNQTLTTDLKCKFVKQKLFLILIFSSFLLSLNAQRIGVRAGVSFAEAQYEYTGIEFPASKLFGIHGGLIAEATISDQVYLNSGILFYRKGTKVSLLGTDIRWPVYYLEIPCNILYKSNVSNQTVYAMAGPYLGIGIFSSTINGDDIEPVGFGAEINELKRLDIGINLGAGIELKTVHLGVNYGLGFRNLSNDPSEMIKNGVLSFSATFYQPKIN